MNITNIPSCSRKIKVRKNPLQKDNDDKEEEEDEEEEEGERAEETRV